MLAIAGTVPDPDFPFVHGRVTLSGDKIKINGHYIEINRCTPALIASALKTAQCVDSPEIYAFLAGDTGIGDGSSKIYKFLTERLNEFEFKSITFHYLQPNVDWHNKVLFAIEDMDKKPDLIADAGFMYAAKMSGQSKKYTFFTPDAGELAFLADDLAPHPFYTRGFILHENNHIPDLIKQAYEHENAASNMVVKGKTDYIVCHGKIIDTVTEPLCEAMEAIGGTGDTLTGILTALLGGNFSPEKAAKTAASANRLSGYYSDLNPATQVSQLIKNIPKAVSTAMSF